MLTCLKIFHDHPRPIHDQVLTCLSMHKHADMLKNFPRSSTTKFCLAQACISMLTCLKIFHDHPRPIHDQVVTCLSMLKHADMLKNFPRSSTTNPRSSSDLLKHA